MAWGGGWGEQPPLVQIGGRREPLIQVIQVFNSHVFIFGDVGNLRLAVMLPEGEDINEWVAVNTVDFFNQGLHLEKKQMKIKLTF